MRQFRFLTLIPSFDSLQRFWIRILSGRNWGIPPDKNTSIGFRIGVVFYSGFCVLGSTYLISKMSSSAKQVFRVWRSPHSKETGPGNRMP